MRDGGWAPEQIGGPFGTTFVHVQYMPADEACSRENAVSCRGIKLTSCTPQAPTSRRVVQGPEIIVSLESGGRGSGSEGVSEEERMEMAWMGAGGALAGRPEER